MKEDNLSTEEMWQMIVTCLKAASSAGAWAFWRERFNTNHPEHIRKQEIENPAQYAKANFFAAKGLYCAHKEQLDRYHNQQWAWANSPTHVEPRKEDCEMFDAMKRVVEEEMAKELEEQVLTAPEPEEPETYWEGDMYLAVVDQDQI